MISDFICLPLEIGFSTGHMTENNILHITPPSDQSRCQEKKGKSNQPQISDISNSVQKNKIQPE